MDLSCLKQCIPAQKNAGEFAVQIYKIRQFLLTHGVAIYKVSQIFLTDVARRFTYSECSRPYFRVQARSLTLSQTRCRELLLAAVVVDP